MIWGRLTALLLVIALVPGIGVAQPGSTGGSLGGGGESSAGSNPASGLRPAPRKAPDVPAVGANVMDGSWQVVQNCNTGRYEVLLTLRHTSPMTFGGSGKGLTTGASTTIHDGRISGRQVSLRRRVALGVDVWEARLASNGRSFSGTAVSPLWKCTFTAVKR